MVKSARDVITEALNAAGYRILAPGEMDAETLTVADQWLTAQYGISPLVADAERIRSLGRRA